MHGSSLQSDLQELNKCFERVRLGQCCFVVQRMCLACSSFWQHCDFAEKCVAHVLTRLIADIRLLQCRAWLDNMDV